MHIVVSKFKTKSGKEYHSTLLRESYREGGKVKKRTIANLSHCSPQEIEAIRLALKHKGDLSVFNINKRQSQPVQGMSVGAVETVHQIAKRLNIIKALGNDFPGKLALWQVIARVIDQGSRLSAVRLARSHAAGEVLRLTKGFDENDLYDNLGYLEENQLQIERRLFKARRSSRSRLLFLYDVSSSYLEGQCNSLSAYGYNRDGKRGKKQIVIGLLCDEFGEPVSCEVFSGNTQDISTFESQVKKAADVFACDKVTFVGDRGMIKRGGIQALSEHGFHYITAITKPQIESLLISGVFQMSLFDENVCEVDDGGVRYVLRRNPVRAAELAQSRKDKLRKISEFAAKKNNYLAAHPRAMVEVAGREVQELINRLKVDCWLQIVFEGRRLSLQQDEAALTEAAKLDGCYVIKTDLPAADIDAQAVHDRYKDLAYVERAFRTEKTGHLEARPIYVRTAAHTRGHVLVVMLAYMIVRELARCWINLNVTVEEGLKELSSLCTITYNDQENDSIHYIPTPRDSSQALLEAAGVKLPPVLLKSQAKVVTRKRLPERRKTSK
jgi:hypothetical protein